MPIDRDFGSATGLADAIRRREIGSRELLDHLLARIERRNEDVRAIVTLDVDRARERADRADQALRQGEVWGPFHGLPMTVKDTFETAALRTTAGAPVLAHHVPPADAVAVARLKAAGAIVFGKTNTPVFAADAQSYNPLFGVTTNPWDSSRSPGGSSGGAAAALAAGFTPLELGSDIGGSIRNPAHSCGVYGHKPTFGIVPTRGHIPGPPGCLSESDIAVAGPMARSAEDLDVALGVLAGASDERAVAWRLELPPPRRSSLPDYRVGLWLDDPACPIDAEIREILEAAADRLRNAGVRADERARPAFDFADAARTFLELLQPIMATGLPREQFEALVSLAGTVPADDRSPLAEIARNATIRHREWMTANEKREIFRARWADLFREVDVLLCPVTAVAAIAHDHAEPVIARKLRVNGVDREYLDALIAWAGVVGMAYLPATVAPVGRTKAGLPVGVQIVGPYLEDRTPIDFARRMADVLGGFEAPPAFR